MNRCLHHVQEEEIDVFESLGRVTSGPVIAKISSPNHNAAAMDGIMVIASKTFEANEANPVTLKQHLDFEYINTGHMITEPFDSVIMIEDVTCADEGKVQIKTQAAPWQHVRPVGEDVVSGEMILPENHQIRPMDIGAVLAGGVTRIKVYEKIKVGIIPTGDEITDCYETLSPGMTFDTNSWTFKAIVEQMGGIANRISPIPDIPELLREAILKMTQENHIVVVNAGSSAGSKDYTAKLIEELGELLLHGIAIKPGKPTILGIINEKPVIGVPGYPGSAFVVFEEIVGPIIGDFSRTRRPSLPQQEAVVSRRIVSSLKFQEYIRVKLGLVDEKLIATPLNRGAGVNMSLVRADGLLVIPQRSEGIEAGETVSVHLTGDLETIRNTIVSIGSHDLIMDYIGSLLARDKKGIHLSSAHVGSMGGIMALKRGEAHIAPIHLLDEETGIYNTSYISKYLDSNQTTLIKGVKRMQGFILKKGNPKGIRSITDLAREDILFVNRQKGSGTRILFDYLLKQNQINAQEIKGYFREMTTHMAVAAAVKSGTADVGIGVFSAAEAMDLEFVEIGFEEYDFAVPNRYMNTPQIDAFVDILRSRPFYEILNRLGGYEVNG